MAINLRMGARTSECVSPGHPDKYMDRVADAILDRVIREDADLSLSELRRIGCRVAIEGVAKDNLVFLAGELSVRPALETQKIDVRAIARRVWEDTGYDNAGDLIVMDHIQHQSPELNSAASEFHGAGDQGVMVGYATDETDAFMPLEYLLARQMITRIIEARKPGTPDADRIDWVRSDAKTQVTLDPEGRVRSVVVAVQHADLPELIEDRGNIRVMTDEAKDTIKRKIVLPVVGPYLPDGGLDSIRVSVNGAGSFVIGGPPGDAGEVGRKIVVDAYGPRVPVGGGAYSGKDPTKVDRSSAYMARHVAKTIVKNKVHGARECLVHIAYGIGLTEPEMVTAVTDKGEDLGDWARENFSFEPWNVIERLGLWKPQGWNYEELSTYGHYGRENYPWEQVQSL